MSLNFIVRITAPLLLSLALFLVSCSSSPPPLPLRPSQTLNQTSLPTGESLSNRALISPAGQGDESFCPVLQLPKVTDLDVYQTPLLSLPPARVSFHDPIFGPCLARISDTSTDMQPGDNSKSLKPEGAGVQAFNQDNSLLLALSGGSHWYIYATSTLALVDSLPFSGLIEPRWSPQAANQLYYISESRLFLFSLETRQSMPVHNFALDFPQLAIQRVSLTHSGNPSIDGRFFPLAALDSSGQALAMMIYDLSTDQISASLVLPAETSLNGVMLSPRGDYFLAWYNQNCPDPPASPGLRCGVVSYDSQLLNPQALLPATGAADMAVDPSGREVLIFEDTRLNSLSMLDLATQQVQALWLIDVHNGSLNLSISGQATMRSGWALVSSYSPDVTDQTWMDNTLFAMELKPDGRVVRLAHTHTQADASGSFAGPQAVPNADFTRVLFASNWGHTSGGESDLYLLALPPQWPGMVQ